jgi:hypothetical protein
MVMSPVNSMSSWRSSYNSWGAKGYGCSGCALENRAVGRCQVGNPEVPVLLRDPEVNFGESGGGIVDAHEPVDGIAVWSGRAADEERGAVDPIRRAVLNVRTAMNAGRGEASSCCAVVVRCCEGGAAVVCGDGGGVVAGARVMCRIFTSVGVSSVTVPFGWTAMLNVPSGSLVVIRTGRPSGIAMVTAYRVIAARVSLSGAGG